jgi:hypothetical protein
MSVFVVLTAVNLVITYLYVPETARISLEEMDQIFGEDREVEVQPIRQIDVGGKDHEGKGGARDEK